MYLAAPTNRHYLPRIRVEDGACEVQLDVRPSFHHAAGAVHGSILFKLLDERAFFAANSRILDRFVLTSAFQLHLLRPVRAGTLTARARLVHQGRRPLVADSLVANEAGKVVARGTGTFMVGDTPLRDATKD